MKVVILTDTGRRLKRVAEFLDEEPFCLTYGDGVSSVNISESIKFHKSHSKEATLTATLPPGRFRALKFNGDQIEKLEEKPEGDEAFINGGFFVLNKSMIGRIKDDQTV